MEMNIEDDSFEDNVRFCPTCRLAMYPTNDTKKFFLLTCRVCKYEDQLDYEFTWEKQKVNKRSILSSVRKQAQGKGTCCPCGVLTAMETRLNFHRALENKGSTELLSVEHLTDQYSEEEERKTGVWYDGSKGYKLIEVADIVSKKGVLTDFDYASKGKRTHKGKSCCRAKCHRNRNAQFPEICDKILKGNALFTSIPITKLWSELKAGEMYIADLSAVIMKKNIESWHGIVLVGFGRDKGVNYFRFQNSHGVRFCEKGFGIVRANEICDIARFEPYHTIDH